LARPRFIIGQSGHMAWYCRRPIRLHGCAVNDLGQRGRDSTLSDPGITGLTGIEGLTGISVTAGEAPNGRNSRRRRPALPPPPPVPSGPRRRRPVGADRSSGTAPGRRRRSPPPVAAAGRHRPVATGRSPGTMPGQWWGYLPHQGTIHPVSWPVFHDPGSLRVPWSRLGMSYRFPGVSRGVNPVIPGVSGGPGLIMGCLRRISPQTTHDHGSTGARSDGRGWCYWSEQSWSSRRPPGRRLAC
jgi:hypothetical protein